MYILNFFTLWQVCLVAVFKPKCICILYITQRKYAENAFIIENPNSPVKQTKWVDLYLFYHNSSKFYCYYMYLILGYIIFSNQHTSQYQTNSM